MTLRERVGQKLGWPPLQSEAFLGNFGEAGPLQQSGNESSPPTAGSQHTQHRDNGDTSLVDAALDGFLTGDPMDLLQWDEWEKTETGMFTD